MANPADVRHFADAAIRPADSPQRHLVVELAGELFALPPACVREVVPFALLSRPPGLPSFLQGFLNLRGVAVPVLRLDRLLNLAEQPPGLYTPLVIFRAAGRETAAPVNRIIGLVAESDSAAEPLDPAESFNGCSAGELRFAGGSAHRLRPDRLLLAAEQRRMAEFADIDQRRLREAGAGEPTP